MSRTNHFLIGLTFALSTTAAHSQDVNRTFYKKDVGRQITVSVGETIAFVLPTYLGANTYWTPRPNPNYKLNSTPINIEDPKHPPHMITKFDVTFVRAGKTNIEIAAVPSGYGGGNASNYIKFKFKVIT